MKLSLSRGRGMRASSAGFVVSALLMADPAMALDCKKLNQSRINAILTATMAVDGQRIPLKIEISRSAVTIVRMRNEDGALDILTEMRDFAPMRTMNGLNGETATFTLRLVEGEISGFEEGDKAVYEQTMTIQSKLIKTERVKQSVGKASIIQLSGCDIPVVRVERLYEDKASGAKRASLFDYAPSLTYPLMSRLEVPTATGPRDQVIETSAIEIDEPASRK